MIFVVVVICRHFAFLTFFNTWWHRGRKGLFEGKLGCERRSIATRYVTEGNRLWGYIFMAQ